MSWLNLLTPSAAVIAIFLGLALVVQSFRHGRAIRRLEQQIAAAGLAAYDPTLDRLKVLTGLSEDARAGSRVRGLMTRRNAIVAAVVVGVLVAAGVAWALMRGSGSSVPGKTASSGTTTHHVTTQTRPATTSTSTTSTTSACANATPIGNPTTVTVSLYNGSGVSGAAGKVISPKLSAIGYAIGTVANAPSGISGAALSQIEYVSRSNLDAACSVATVLGVPATQVAPLTLLPAAQAAPSQVVVLIGKDIASG